MENLTQFGVPVLGIIIAGFMIWASLQAVKNAITVGKWYYIPVTALLGLIAGALITITMAAWSWKTFAWIAWAGWIASHLLHKFYARYLQNFIMKPNGQKANGG